MANPGENLILANYHNDGIGERHDGQQQRSARRIHGKVYAKRTLVRIWRADYGEYR